MSSRFFYCLFSLVEWPVPGLWVVAYSWCCLSGGFWCRADAHSLCF